MNTSNWNISLHKTWQCHCAVVRSQYCLVPFRTTLLWWQLQSWVSMHSHLLGWQILSVENRLKDDIAKVLQVSSVLFVKMCCFIRISQFLQKLFIGAWLQFGKAWAWSKLGQLSWARLGTSPRPYCVSSMLALFHLSLSYLLIHTLHTSVSALSLHSILFFVLSCSIHVPLLLYKY